MYYRKHTKEKFPDLRKLLQDSGTLTAKAIKPRISAGKQNWLIKSHNDAKMFPSNAISSPPSTCSMIADAIQNTSTKSEGHYQICIITK